MTHLINYNRKQALKEWKPIPSIQLTPNQIQYYNQKIQYVCDLEKDDKLPTCELINIEDLQPQIDVNYVKYLALKHQNDIIQYIKSKGVILNDIEWNIRQILNEIIKGEVDEDYYLNTIEIYESISNSIFEPDIYYLINQATRLDNKRMLYYLIFKKDEEMADRVYEVIRE